MSRITITRNDTKPKFIDALTLNDAPIDLSGSTVKFLMKNESKSVEGSATITSAVAGTVEYQPIAADVDTSGLYEQEWEVTFGDGKILSVPNGEKNVVRIIDDLG